MEYAQSAIETRAMRAFTASGPDRSSAERFEQLFAQCLRSRCEFEALRWRMKLRWLRRAQA
jgi:hypothetical protein